MMYVDVVVLYKQNASPRTCFKWLTDICYVVQIEID